MRIKLIFSTTFLFFFSLSFGQTVQFKDDFSKSSIIAYITDSLKTSLLFSDLNGVVSLPKNETLEINAFGYQAKKIAIHSDTTIFLKRLNQALSSENNKKASTILEQTVRKKKNNDPESKIGFSYNSYNKFIISSEKSVINQSKLSTILHKVIKTPFKIPKIENQHFILIESESERQYKSNVNDEEIVTNAQFTGIDKPNFITINSQINSLSLYAGFIEIAGKSYTNPLPLSAQKKYNFQLIDSIHNDSETQYIIHFGPKKNTRFESLTGLYIINKKKYGIQYFVTRPAIQRGNSIITYHQFNQELNNGWFPKTILTTLSLENIGQKSQIITASTQTYLFNQQHKEYTRKFSDVALAFSKKINTTPLQRQLPLSKKDSNTIRFYDKVGAIKNFSKSIEFAEKLYHKQVYLKYYTLDLNHVNRLNRYEGLRLGLSLSTNDKLYDNGHVGGYISYGFSDKKAKYGAHFSHQLIKEEKLSIRLSTQTDDFESGSSSFIRSKNQYSSEWLRKLKIIQLDNTISYKVSFLSKPIRFLSIIASIENKQTTPNYAYTFNSIDKFNYTITSVQTRFAFGELFIKLEKSKIPLKTKFPIVFLNLSKGSTTNKNLFNYTKIEGKIEYTLKLPTLGSSIFQLHSGYINNPVPYGINFNGKGSQEIATVAHNSFETMKYNEFVNNQFVALYYTHDFGYLNFIEYMNFRPKVHIALNAGIGKLKNKEYHEKLDVQDFRKGYFEAGFLVKELIQLRLSVVKASFGIGLYQRIGAYRSSEPWGNQTIKIATGFKF